MQTIFWQNWICFWCFSPTGPCDLLLAQTNCTCLLSTVGQWYCTCHQQQWNTVSLSPLSLSETVTKCCLLELMWTECTFSFPHYIYLLLLILLYYYRNFILLCLQHAISGSCRGRRAAWLSRWGGSKWPKEQHVSLMTWFSFCVIDMSFPLMVMCFMYSIEMDESWTDPRFCEDGDSSDEEYIPFLQLRYVIFTSFISCTISM